MRGLWRLVTGDPFARYRLAERAAAAISPSARLSEFGRSWIDDAAFVRAMEAFDGEGNRRGLDRKWTLDQLLKLVRRVEGDTAECGTWKGGSSWLLARAGRTHHAFDSFEGLSQPGAGDGTHFRKGELAVSEEEFRRRLSDFPGVKTYKGWIPSRFAEVAERRFCFIHVDVDLEQPTADSVAFFYPRLNRGGILLLDDYGFAICPGARRAVDDFFRDKPEAVIELPTGQGVVIRE
jgi:hypothetical protein